MAESSLTADLADNRKQFADAVEARDALLKAWRALDPPNSPPDVRGQAPRAVSQASTVATAVGSRSGREA